MQFDVRLVTHTFTNLTKYKDGEEIQYTVREKAVPTGYTENQRTNGTNDYTIINTHDTGETEVTVNKEWVDNNDQDGLRPDSIIVELLADGEVIDEEVLNDSNNWTHTFTGLPTKLEGKDIVYTVREKDVPEGYDLIYRGVEITTGAEREHRYDVLVKQAKEKGLDKDVEFYLEFFKYGCPPHGGFGLGVDRLTMLVLGLPSVKESMLIFRGPNRLNP